ncbi:MAG: ComEC family competence protein, partial [Alphaproteobacteria bacterium]|nr:ComEC family competence protein [Alphaproteobacteria bacterium]
RIAVLAQVHAPSPPVAPDAFDFQRYLYFQGIGGVGFAYKLLDAPAQPSPAPLGHIVERARQDIAQEIENHMAYPAASVAMALTMGRTTAMNESDQQAMRVSGLAHVLSISGLHVGLFSGVVFFVLRLAMAAIPGLALRHPIKKYAALAAMLAAVVYMLLAGSTVPVQRSVLMAGLVFLAVITDRSPISLRLLAFAACVVLLLFPDALMSASFQMSFSAVTALMVFFDWFTPAWSRWSRQAGLLRKIALYFMGICLTSLVASVATTPFSLFHFQQAALYGILGNLLAAPVIAFLIMPAVVAALFFMPFGLAAPPLFVMEKGIDVFLEIARWTASLPHAALLLPAWPQAALGLIAMGALFMILWSGKLRILGLVPILAAIPVIAFHAPPDILVSPKGRIMQIRADDGDLYVSGRDQERFVREGWAQLYGVIPDSVQVFPKEGGAGPVLCDPQACRISLKGHSVSWVRHASAREQECAQAEIVMAPFPLKRCSARMTIDFYDARDEGAHALYFYKNGSVRIENVQDSRGARPWSMSPDFLNEKAGAGNF